MQHEIVPAELVDRIAGLKYFRELCIFSAIATEFLLTSAQYIFAIVVGATAGSAYFVQNIVGQCTLVPCKLI